MVALLRSLRVAARPVLAAPKVNAARAFSVSALRASAPAPPKLYGEGVKAGEVPTECVRLRRYPDMPSRSPLLQHLCVLFARTTSRASAIGVGGVRVSPIS